MIAGRGQRHGAKPHRQPGGFEGRAQLLFGARRIAHFQRQAGEQQPRFKVVRRVRQDFVREFLGTVFEAALGDAGKAQLGRRVRRVDGQRFVIARFGIREPVRGVEHVPVPRPQRGVAGCLGDRCLERVGGAAHVAQGPRGLGAHRRRRRGCQGVETTRRLLAAGVLQFAALR